MKRIKGWLLLCLACSMLFTGCQIGDKNIVILSPIGKKYVFSLGNESCSVKEARLYLANYRNIYGNAYTLDLWQHEFKNASLEEYIKSITLNNLVSIVSMMQLAEEKGMVLTETEEESIKEAATVYYDSLSGTEREVLDVSVSDLTEYYRHYALAQKVYETLTSEINSEVSDDEARVMDVMQIYVTDVAKAGEVQEKLDNGEDFASVANMYNELSSIQASICRADLSDEAEQIVFLLDNNEFTDRMKVENGYYFVKCINKFNQVLTEENKLIIVEKREKDALNSVYSEFMKGLQSYLNEDAWNSLTLDKVATVGTDSFFDVYNMYCK